MQQTINLLGSVLLLWAAVVGNISVWEHSRVRWRASVMGRHLMAYMLVVAALLDLGLVRFVVFGGSANLWFELLRLAVFVFLPVVMTHRLVLQIRARREGLAHHGHPDPAPSPAGKPDPAQPDEDQEPRP